MFAKIQSCDPQKNNVLIKLGQISLFVFILSQIEAWTSISKKNLKLKEKCFELLNEKWKEAFGIN